MSNDLERLYLDAKAALDKKDYGRAADLLRQILLVNHDYKDAAQLLARVIKISRRSWYNDPRLWGTIGVLFLVGLGIYFFPKFQNLYNRPEPISITNITNFETDTPSPTIAPSSAIATTMLPSAPTPLPLTWKRVSLGQEVKRDSITAIAVDPHDPDVIYVGTEHAGVYKSIDGGRSWIPSHNGLERAQIRKIVIDPQNPNILNVHTFPDQIYKSKNGGQSWKLTLDDLEIYISQEYYMSFFSRALVLDPHNGQHLLLMDRNGWYESSDSGETWMYQGNMWGDCPSLLGAVGFHPQNPNILFLSQMGDDGNCKNGIYRWNKGEGSIPELVFRYDRRPGTDPNHYIVITDILSNSASEDDGYIYARTLEHGKVYGSSDGGQTWLGDTRTGANRTPNCPAFTVQPDGQGFGFCFVPGGNARVATTYGGQNWKFTNIPSLDWVYTGSGVSAISFFPDQPQSVLLGGHGLFVTFDNGASWSEKNNGLPGISVDLQYGQPYDSLFLMERNYCQGGENLLQSINEGRTWNLMTAQGCGLAIDAEGNTLYRFDGGNSIFLSRNGGKSWGSGARPTIGDSRVVAVAADPERPGVAVAKIRVGLSSSLTSSDFFITTDKGFTWQKYGNITENSGSEDMLLKAPGQNDIFYSVGPQSNVYRLDDGNHTWTACKPIDIVSPNSASSLAIHPNDEDKVYLSTLGSGIQYSQDGCASWESRNDGLDSLFVNTLAIDPNNPHLLYAGTDGGAYISSNAGQTWEQLNDGLLGATVVYSIAVDPESNVYAATPYGIFLLEGK